LPIEQRGWGGHLYHHEKEHLDRNHPFRCHCPHRPSGHGRHAELRNDIEKSGLKKEQRFKNKKTGARRESRSLFSSIYFVLSSNLRTCPCKRPPSTRPLKTKNSNRTQKRQRGGCEPPHLVMSFSRGLSSSAHWLMFSRFFCRVDLHTLTFPCGGTLRR
jgi:hypothetical protein